MELKFRRRFSTQIVLLGLAVAVTMSLTFAYVIPYIHLRFYDQRKAEIGRMTQAGARLAAGVVARRPTGAGLDPEMKEQLTSLLEELGRDGENQFWIADRSGRMILRPESLNWLDQTVFGGKSDSGRDYLKRMTSAGPDQTRIIDCTVRVDGRDRAMLAGAGPIAGRPWLLVGAANTADIEKNISEFTMSLGAIVGLKFLVVAAACFLLGKSLGKPVRKVLAWAETIGQGDLSSEDMKTRRRDELGLMTKALNRMKNSLRDDVRLASAAAFLARMAAQDVRESSQAFADRTAGRAAASRQLSQAVTGVNRAVQSISQKAKEANEEAARLAEEVKSEQTPDSAETADRVWRLSTTVSDIAAHCWEQSLIMAEVEQSIQEADQAVQADVTMVDELNLAVKNMDEEADNLFSQMRRFKLD